MTDQSLWVSVKEHGPPDNAAWCLVTGLLDTKRYVDLGQYYRGLWHGIDHQLPRHILHENVLAYIVLPEPYEGE